MELPNADILVVGSGPAGVSAAIPLVEAGWRVLMIDAGLEAEQPPPAQKFYAIRTQDWRQWKLFVGAQFQALRADVPASPKFRAPTNAFAYAGYRQAYNVRAANFSVIGSLAAGGLSNIWGAGVSYYTADDLRDFPITRTELEPSYRAITARIGISGSDSDDLADFFGADISLQPPTALNENAARLLRRYNANRAAARRQGVALGRARNAVLTQDLGERQRCDESNACVWGCARGAIYSAAFDLARLRRHDNFHYCGRLMVESLRRQDDRCTLRIRPLDGSEAFEHPAKKIILACGALGSAKLVLNALGIMDRELPFVSSPTLGFAVWLPERLGAAVARQGFGLSQLSFSVRGSEERNSAFGNLFGTDGLLTSELIRYLPFSAPTAIGFARLLSPSLLLGNCFLPGHFSRHSFSCRSDGTLEVHGAYHNGISSWVAEVKRRLNRMFLRYGMVILPNSFQLTTPGSDVHYAATLPMRRAPESFQTRATGEIAALAGVYVVDGAVLSALPGKAHTLTIMANADRIARRLAAP